MSCQLAGGLCASAHLVFTEVCKVVEGRPSSSSRVLHWLSVRPQLLPLLVRPGLPRLHDLAVPLLAPVRPAGDALQFTHTGQIST
jgi:hypothetical protein